MNSVTAIGGMVLQVFVNQMGTAYVAAYAACMKVCGLFEQPGVTVGLALLTFTGQNYGAKKYDRIKSGVGAGVICRFWSICRLRRWKFSRRNSWHL